MTYIRLIFCYLLLVCALGFPGRGLAQVSGNKYREVFLDKNTPINTNNVTITAKTPGGAAAGANYPYIIQQAFDGNDNTYWSSGQSGTINIDLTFTSPITLSGFRTYGGGSDFQRESQVKVYASEDYVTWTLVQTFSNDRSARAKDYTMEQALTTRYLRLQLIPYATSHWLVMHEITLYSGYLDMTKAKITHKASKWFDLRSGISEGAKSLDTFNDDVTMFTLQDGITDVQAAHTYIDTIYVHKGTSVNLIVPDQLKQIKNGNVSVSSSVMSYQRWYSFRTDGIFRTLNTGENEVWDLLTPTESTIKPYRMSNGYVAKPIATSNLMEMTFYVPTDDEFKKWFGDEYVQKYDNNYYLVACDVSGYTDFTKNFSTASSGSSIFYPSNQSDGLSYEPTLTHRIIYYIQAVDNRDEGIGNSESWRNGMKRLKTPEYQGGTDEGRYLEEYDISFPYTRISNNTHELVALSKDARSYSIPDAKTEDNNILNVRLDNGNSGITLDAGSEILSGIQRVIHFSYPVTNPNGTQTVVDENSKATIYVTKTVGDVTYNIAKYNLTFVSNTRLITQTQLKQIENGTIQDENMKYYQFRTEKYLDENYDLLTQLDFDYDQDVGNMYGQHGYYPFPLDWESSSYSFYDGAVEQDYNPSSSGHYYPEWGYYSIMSGFMENLYWGSSAKAEKLPGSTYHMYVDASDRAGVIARLPFKQNLCPGSEMFVTAWVKSAVDKNNQQDAGMLFSVMGVTTDRATGQIVYVPIYRHASGQIRRTDFLSGMPGTGNGTNEWLQMYFSFIIDSNVQFDYYVLQVDNNSASTEGGDMYIDDIRVYMTTPSAKVNQLEATCTSKRTLMNIELDWDRLLSRLGELEGTGKIDGIDYCFIDKVKYERYLTDHDGDTDKYLRAIEESVVAVGSDAEDGDDYNEPYNTLYFNLNFDENKSYELEEHPRLAQKNKIGSKYYLYGKETGAGIRSLSVDVYSEFVPNRAYLMLMMISDGDAATANDFAENITDACAIVTPFYVTSLNTLRINGEIVNPTTDFCAGQIFNFSAQVRIPRTEADGSESYITLDEGVYFDWFFGTEEEYLNPNQDYGGVSLQKALTTFRTFYPNIEDLSEAKFEDLENQHVEFTEAMFNLIVHYATLHRVVGGMHPALVLHKDKLDITLLKDGLQLVVQPIPIQIHSGGIGGNIPPELWANVCWSYVPLVLNASGAAPQVFPGFNALKYPSDEFSPSLRIGLKQIQSLSEETPLKVDLRGAKLVTADAKSLGLITSASPDVFNKIYLIDTNDPAYKNDTFFPVDFSEYSLPVGTIKSFLAEPYKTGSFTSEMEIYFDLTTTQDNGFRFSPKEGYFYTLAFHFEEKLEDGFSAVNSCFGVFNMVMKVVPEYLVWNASGANGNWNNDANWKRADKTDLKKPESDTTYPTNEDNTTDNGYVPMLFSNVIMPGDSKVELYMAGYGDSGNSWVNTSRPTHMLPPTKDIQYDLMTYHNDSLYSTERYRVNICGDIHFEPGAQMLHAEQLIYNKAWVDVEMLPGQWNAVSVPLEGVVAGDWYAPTESGRQETEYFTDISFADGGYNRLNPAVYQRSWSTGAKIVENNDPQGEGFVNVPVSFATDWSSVYNDAYVPYTAGGGFSVKGILNQGSKDQTQSQTALLFRFPKSDDIYDVSTGNLERTNAGKLLISGLVDRSDPLKYNPKENVSTVIAVSADGMYLMVGNPFMAPLDVQAFMEANSDVLQQKYWLQNPNTSKAVSRNSDGKWPAELDYVAPYSVFYVAVNNSDPGTPLSEVTVKFTASMQKFVSDASAGNETPEASETPQTFRIEAMDAHGKSTATLTYSSSADNRYQSEEDAEMIQNLDGNNRQIPMVYTIAGDRAASANQVKDSRSVPLGVFAAEDSPVTLTFRGVGTLNQAVLYDAETGRETYLTEGYSLAVNGSSHGRYFIRTEGATGMEIQTVDDLSVYSVVPNQIIVTSHSQLGEITIWSTDGALLKTVRPDSNVCTLNGIASGVVLVKIQAETPVVRKVMVK